MRTPTISALMSPATIFGTREFAVALYDPQVRLLAQAPALPLFMGTMGFCVEGAVAAAGGVGGSRGM